MTLPVKFRTHAGIPFLLRSREKARKLFSVQEQLLGTGRVRHHMGAGRIQWRDVAPEQECLTVLDEHVGICQLGFLCPQTFDFPSLQNNTRFERVLDKVVMTRFFILHYGVVRDFCFLGFGHRVSIARSGTEHANLLRAAHSP